VWINLSILEKKEEKGKVKSTSRKRGGLQLDAVHIPGANVQELMERVPGDNSVVAALALIGADIHAAVVEARRLV
jgi:hypothetical protein